MKELIVGIFWGLMICIIIWLVTSVIVLRGHQGEFKTAIKEMDSRIEQVESDMKVLKGASHEEIELDTARKLFNGPMRDPFTRLK